MVRVTSDIVYRNPGWTAGRTIIPGRGWAGPDLLGRRTWRASARASAPPVTRPMLCGSVSGPGAKSWDGSPENLGDPALARGQGRWKGDCQREQSRPRPVAGSVWRRERPRVDTTPRPGRVPVSGAGREQACSPPSDPSAHSPRGCEARKATVARFEAYRRQLSRHVRRQPAPGRKIARPPEARGDGRPAERIEIGLVWG